MKFCILFKHFIFIQNKYIFIKFSNISNEFCPSKQRMEQSVQKRTLKVTDGTYGVGNFLVVLRWYFGEKKRFLTKF
jgi:hypothetical protein